MPDAEGPSATCLVCKDPKHPVEYACAPCNHAILCKKCAMKMATGGLLAMLFLAFRKTARAIVLDKDKRLALWNVWDAWQPFMPAGGAPHAGAGDAVTAASCPPTTDAPTRHACANSDSGSEHTPRTAQRRLSPRPGEEGCPLECIWGDLRDELPTLLERLPGDTLVLACHACSHLTDIILDICATKRVDFAVMPCCHKDRDGNQVTVAAASLGIPMAAAMDLVRFGRMQQLGYTVRWRTIDPAITPHNRILCGLIAGTDKTGPASLAIPAKKDAKGNTYKRADRGKKSSCSMIVAPKPVKDNCA
eukprot:jgi/Mesvir1/26324/Mv22504-RA.1